MKAVQISKPLGDFEVVERPVPQPGEIPRGVYDGQVDESTVEETTKAPKEVIARVPS